MYCIMSRYFCRMLFEMRIIHYKLLMMTVMMTVIAAIKKHDYNTKMLLGPLVSTINTFHEDKQNQLHKCPLLVLIIASMWL